VSEEKSKTTKPVGVSGAEYRRQWNRLNKDRIRKAQKKYYARHPEKHRQIPREVVEKYRIERRAHNKPHYYRGWDKAPNRKTRWTDKETEILIRHEGADRQLSAILGRSINAIQKRRHRMRMNPCGESK
jgi:hypothetical protein